MFDRASLHTIVDALPDESLDAAFRVLEHYQKHPPRNESDPEILEKRARDGFTRKMKNRQRRTGVGTGLLGECLTPEGYGMACAEGWEGQTHLTSTVVFFRGNEICVAERLNLSEDKTKINYSVEARLLGGEPERHEFVFHVAG